MASSDLSAAVALNPGNIFAGAVSSRPAGATLDRRDLLPLLAAMLFTALCAYGLWLLWDGLLPVDDRYYGGDPMRVLTNLRSTQSDFHRTPFHPLFASFCAMFANIQQSFGIGTKAMLAGGSVFYGTLSGGLTYVTARLFGAEKQWALAAVALFCASGGFIAWSSIPESHVWGGISVLICLIGAHFLPTALPQRVLASAGLFVIASSAVFTNILSWAFATCLVERADRFGLTGIVSIIRRNLLPFTISLALGLLLLYLASLAQSAYFYPNTALGQFLSFEGDHKYFFKGGFGYKLNGLFAFGLFAPYPNRIVNLAGLLVTLIAVGTIFFGLRRATPTLRMLTLYLPAILVWHSIYARDEAFICAPNYVAVFSILLVVAASRIVDSVILRYCIFVAIAGIGLFNLIEHIRVIAAMPIAYRFPI